MNNDVLIKQLYDQIQDHDNYMYNRGYIFGEASTLIAIQRAINDIYNNEEMEKYRLGFDWIYKAVLRNINENKEIKDAINYINENEVL